MGSLMAMLAFGKIGFIAVMAFIASRAVQRLKDDPDHKRSTLCATSDQWELTRK